jgi:putative sigma-54 modulation protein
MKIQFTNKDKSELSTQLVDLTKKKLQKITKLAEDATAHITFETRKHMHIAEGTLHSHGTSFHAKDETKDMYKSVDGLITKLISQFKKHRS